MSQHTTPCNECPFRRKSLPGYVGGHTDASEIIDYGHEGIRFPCHMAVTSLTEEFKDDEGMDEEDAFNRATEEAPVCAGSIAFMNNSAKMSQDPKLKALQDQIGKRADVFNWPQEMMKHHHGPKAEYISPMFRAMGFKTSPMTVKRKPLTRKRKRVK